MKLKTDYGITLYRIHDNIFQRGKMHKLSLTQKIRLLEDYDITIVVGLAPAYKDEHLVKLDKKRFIDYIHFPIPDGLLSDAVRFSLLQLANEISKFVVKDKTSVLCFCNAGRNRSGLLNALMLRNLCHYSGSAALEVVRKERPRAIANPYFEDFLRRLP